MVSPGERLLAQASGVVSVQADCSIAEAHDLTESRARSMDKTVEWVALAVLERRLGHAPAVASGRGRNLQRADTRRQRVPIRIPPVAETLLISTANRQSVVPRRDEPAHRETCRRARHGAAQRSGERATPKFRRWKSYRSTDSTTLDVCDPPERTGRSNGPTEGINLLIKKIKRVGHGFRNFANYRLRLLLHCGAVKWQTHQTARVRGRQPRFAARATIAGPATASRSMAVHRRTTAIPSSSVQTGRVRPFTMSRK